MPDGPRSRGFSTCAQLMPDAMMQVGKPAPTGGLDAPVAAGFLPEAELVRDAMVQVGKPAPTRRHS